MSEAPPESMTEGQFDFFDDERELYFWRDEGTDSTGLIFYRSYTEEERAEKAKRLQLDGLRAQADEAIPYLDERIDICLAYVERLEPASLEDLAAQLKIVSDLAAYSAGTLKRLIVVLGELTGRPV
ncbi:hypothetical protein PBI_PAEDORE_47 [Streptomyces phage Paedore]|uniref:Uncharacterized protein n=1 Tax=Streptomyces phage Paedore TaxID=2108134 RepID=A0A2P1JTQ2_9CAUD|nr:hypothetical protein KGG91_gp47 [Streptomyces phage Paedore]AVO22530.1 hypothetical protein PBI_PAEDORE_47 [Streptomyces phage Paedore]